MAAGETMASGGKGGNRPESEFTRRERERLKQAALDRAVQAKYGLVGWLNQPAAEATGTAARRAAVKRENQARDALKARDLEETRRQLGQAIGQRMQALSPRGRKAIKDELRGEGVELPEGGRREHPLVRQHLRGHERGVGRLRGVEQAVRDVASAYAHEVDKIEGRWPPKGKRRR
jgi:hypothetical protein